MISGVVDTNILIHLFRKNAAAQAWVASQSSLAITPIIWLEFVGGATGGKAGLAKSVQLAQQFALELLTPSDQQWAMQQMLAHRLRHGVHMADCLIASVAYRLQVPLYTQNVKDFEPLLGSTLVLQPY